jgi:Zn-dependent protease/CBS domain-containing protein
VREASAALAITTQLARSIEAVASTTPEPGRNGPGQKPAQRLPEPGIVVARPFGIPVIISPYWFLIAGVFIFLYAHEWSSGLHGTTRYAVAAVFVVLLYVSVLFHELSHSLVARRFRLPVRRILLYPLGGISEIEQEPQTPAREFLVSAAGPALSLVLAGLGYALSRVVSGSTVGGEIVEQLWWANLVVGVFNLLPGLPLDGGRMLRAVIWQFTKKPAASTIAAAWAGRVLAIALLVVPLAMSASRGSTYMQSAVWLAVIAVFMWMGATQAIRATRFRERLPMLQARRLARKAISVNASTPLAEAVRRAEESQARAVVVVDHEDKPIAIVDESAVIATPPQRRPWIDTGTLARTLDPNMIIPADLSGMELLNAMRRAQGASEYLLVEPSGQVYGVLAAKDVEMAFAGV